MPREEKPKTRKPAGPRPVTPSYLRNAALHYVSQRAASAAMVRQTLERRAMRRLAVRSLDDATNRMIEDVVAELCALGLIDDARFTETRTATLAAKGLSRAHIGATLRAKGIAQETIDEAVAGTLDELTLARRFVARKRLGPLRRGGETPQSRRKDLAALARAGFSFQVASRALSEPEDD